MSVDAGKTFTSAPGFVIKIFTKPTGADSLRGMSASNFQARRATVDDLVALHRLWQSAGLEGEGMERQLKDLQIVETPDGTLLGALAFQISKSEGRIHSETYAGDRFSDELRGRLWERVQAVARNHGLFRVWIEAEAAAWGDLGFAVAGADVLKKFPPSFGDREQLWLVKTIREEPSALVSLEQELEIFAAAQRESNERMMHGAAVVKNVAYVFLLIFVLLGLLLVVMAMMPNSTLSQVFKGRAMPRTPPADARPPGE